MIERLMGGVIVVLLFAIVAKKISGNLWFGFGALVFFLPFERIPTLEVAQFTLKINHIIGGLLIFFWLAELAYSRRRFRFKTPVYLLGGLLISFILSMTNSHLLFRSAVFFLTNLFVIALFLLASNVIQKKIDLEKVSRVVIVSSYLVVGFAIFQFVGDIAGAPLSFTGLDAGYSSLVFGFPRVQAFSKEPLYLANYLFLPLSLLGALLVAKKERFARHLPLLIGLGLVFLLTLSRGGISGLILALILSVAWFARRVLTLENIFKGLLVFGLVFSFVWGMLRLASPTSAQRFVAHLTVADFQFGESTQGRLHAFNKAIEAWLEHPFVGIGLGNYGAYSANYDLARPQVNDIVNNEYLELLSETGLLGLGFFLAFIVFLLARSARAIKQTKERYLEALLVFLTASLIGTLWQYNFFSTFAIIHIWVLLGILMATQNIALGENYAD